MQSVPLFYQDEVVAHAQVDDEDFTHINSYRWTFAGGYALTYARTCWESRGRLIPMHRMVAGLHHTDPRVVHHCDRDRRNNTRDNLLVLTKTQHERLHMVVDRVLGTEAREASLRRPKQAPGFAPEIAERCATPIPYGQLAQEFAATHYVPVTNSAIRATRYYIARALRLNFVKRLPDNVLVAS